MRNEKEIYGLVMDIAKNDDRIVAVYMNGSRTNSKVPRDIFQDYDIVYVVRETKTFIEDTDWIHKFGKILYMQYPDESPYEPSDRENNYGWLMQFEDGVRIDLTVQTISFTQKHIHDDKLCRILLDKENILPAVPEPTDAQYYVKKPTKAQFLASANEFWWCSNNIAKGLWREEMPYVQDMANFVVRKELERMLSWKVGIITNFQVSVGKSAKYLYKWLGTNEYQEYLDTYFDGNIENAWTAVLRMCDFFERTAEYVAGKLGYPYNVAEGKAARWFLEHVRQLPKDSESF